MTHLPRSGKATRELPRNSMWNSSGKNAQAVLDRRQESQQYSLETGYQARDRGRPGADRGHEYGNSY